MPRNGTGTYTLPEAAFVPLTTIISGEVNSDFSDIATALTQSLATTGVSMMTGPVRLADGSVTAPSLTFSANLGTGFYRSAANVFGMAVGSVSVGLINASATVLWGFNHILAEGAEFTSLAVAQGITSTTTVTGDVIVFTNLGIGTSSPATQEVQIGNAHFDYDGGTAPRWSFDATNTSFLSYTRASNEYDLQIGAVNAFFLNSKHTPFVRRHIKWAQITAPGSAPANNVFLYGKAHNGFTGIYYKDENGVETPMGGPGYWELIGTVTLTTSIAAVGFSFSRLYSRLVICATSVAVNTTDVDAIRVQVSDDGGTSLAVMDGAIIGHIDATNQQIFTNTGDALVDDFTPAVTDANFVTEFVNTSGAGKKQAVSYGQKTNLTSMGDMIGFTTSIGSVNYIQVAWGDGNLSGGRYSLYGMRAL